MLPDSSGGRKGGWVGPLGAGAPFGFSLAAYGKTAGDSALMLQQKRRLDEVSRRLVFTTCLRSHEACSYTFPVLGPGGDCRLTVSRRRSTSTHSAPTGDEPALVAASSRRNGHQLQRHGCGSAPRYSVLPAPRIQRARIGDRLAPRLCGNEQLQPCLHAFDKNTARHLSAAASCSRKWQVPNREGAACGKSTQAGAVGAQWKDLFVAKRE